MSSANPLQLLRSNTAHKRPDPTGLVDGRPAINTNVASPGLFFKDSAGNLVKIGPVHVGPTAPNASPASGGAAGNSVGEQWLDTAGGTYVFKVWDGSAWRSETGTFVDVNGDVMTGALVMDNQQQVRFREVTANGTNYIALQAPASVTSDKTITLPDVNGTVVTTGDTGTVTSTMIADATIVDADISASAEIAVSKLADGTSRQLLQTDAAGTGVEWTSNVDVPGTLDVTGAATFDSTVAVTGTLTKSGSNVVTVGDTGTVTSTMILDGTIVNADVNASAAIAGTKISPDFGSQNVTTTGTATAASLIPTSSTVPTNGVYLPAANSVAISTNGTGRLFVDSSGRVGVGESPSAVFSVNSASTALMAELNSTNANGGYLSLLTSSAVYGDIGTAAQCVSGGSASDFAVNARGSRALVLGTNNIERLRITSDGKVGLGTSSPSDPLHIAVSGANSANIRLQSGDGRTYNIGSTGSGYGSSGKFIIYDITAGAERFCINSSGNVGVGTTSPAKLLHVQSGSVSGAARGGTATKTLFESSDAATSYWEFQAASTAANDILFSKGSSGAYGIIGYDHSIDALRIYVNSLERARIDSSGRLLVGTSTSVSVAGGTNIQQIVSSTNDRSLGLHFGGANVAAPYITFSKSRNTTYGSYTIVSNGDGLGGLLFAGDDGTDYATVGAAIEAYVDGTPGANDLPTRLVFSVTADGASSPSEAVRISQNRITEFQNDIIPGADNSYQVGQSGRRWSVIFAGTGTINTSDANLKQDIEDLEQAELNVATAIKGLIKKFRFIDAVANKGDDARIHVGVIAQEVEQAFVDESLDPRRYAMFCEDTLEDGSKRLGIRYDELLAFVIAAL